MIIFISDKKMSGKDKETSPPKRSLANIFEVQLWRKRKSFYLFLRFNFNGTSTSFDNVILNSVIANQDNASVTVLFRANWVDWVNATNLELISNQKRIIIEPSEVTEIRNRDVKPFKLGLVFDLKSNRLMGAPLLENQP